MVDLFRALACAVGSFWDYNFKGDFPMAAEKDALEAMAEHVAHSTGPECLPLLEGTLVCLMRVNHGEASHMRHANCHSGIIWVSHTCLKNDSIWHALLAKQQSQWTCCLPFLEGAQKSGCPQLLCLISAHLRCPALMFTRGISFPVCELASRRYIQAKISLLVMLQVFMGHALPILERMTQPSDIAVVNFAAWHGAGANPYLMEMFQSLARLVAERRAQLPHIIWKEMVPTHWDQQHGLYEGTPHVYAHLSTQRYKFHT